MQFLKRPRFTEVSECGRYLITSSFTGRQGGERRFYHAWHGPQIHLRWYPKELPQGQVIYFRSISRPLVSRAMAVGICEEHAASVVEEYGLERNAALDAEFRAVIA